MKVTPRVAFIHRRGLIAGGLSPHWLVRYRTTPAMLDPYLDTWDDNFRTLGLDAVPYDERFYRLKRGDTDRLIAAKGPRVDVPMLLLIGPQNSSAAFQFAARCRQAGSATLIGEPTGGNQCGINGGFFFFVRLPASGLEFDLPLIGSFPAGRVPDTGLTPDMLVKQTARDMATACDAVMEAAVARLQTAKIRTPKNDKPIGRTAKRGGGRIGTAG